MWGAGDGSDKRLQAHAKVQTANRDLRGGSSSDERVLEMALLGPRCHVDLLGNSAAVLVRLRA